MANFLEGSGVDVRYTNFESEDNLETMFFFIFLIYYTFNGLPNIVVQGSPQKDTKLSIGDGQILVENQFFADIS